MSDLVRMAALDEADKLTYAGIWLLKKMDIKVAEGGIVLAVGLPSELTPLDEVLMDLQVNGLVAPSKKKDKYEITKSGYAYIGQLIDEAEALIEEFDDEELPDVVAELRRRNLDVFRARFLWGWYTGEFDDLVVFQQRRGIKPVEQLWAYYLMSDDFYNQLALDIEPGGTE